MCVSLQSFGRSGLDPSRCDPKFEVSWMRCDVKGFVTPQMMSHEVKCQGCRPDQRPHSLTAACDAESKAAINRHSQASDSFFSLPK